jgi:AmmeMemoRadiSam system protein B
MADQRQNHCYPRLRPIEVFPVEIRGDTMLSLRDPLQYSAATVYVPPRTAVLLALFDGRHSLRDIQQAYVRRFGELLFLEQLEGLVRQLDEHLLLEGAHFDAERTEIERRFRDADSRPAILAGRGYPADVEALLQQLSSFFDHADGPGGTPPSPESSRLVGLVVPHIDFQRGGPCYAWGYREADGAGEPDRWLVLGTVHAATTQPFALTRKHYETPLGLVQTDRDFVDALLSAVGPAYLADELAHRAEHSIEFQAVFLRRRTPAERSVKIVPVLCGSLHRYVEEGRSPAEGPEVEGFLRALRETLAAAGGRTVVLVSADLAHVGPRFGDPEPLTPGRLQELAEADQRTLRLVEQGDAHAFFGAVAGEQDRRRICGLPPIYAALRLLPGARGRLLRYGQWPDPEGTVTFSAVALYGSGA